MRPDLLFDAALGIMLFSAASILAVILMLLIVI
jgi:hypothetical protein